ncbi:MAG: tRNA uracil 4-sulfurtransferase ThiI [Acutalibacteraceae bacterium]|nr:tRNA uracil 4-sulfurtransferase ThiI [Acutalibacteraceae bacterium]
MEEIILIKIGEIVLKGLNKKTFEDALIKNLRRRLCKAGQFDIKIAQSTITVAPKNENADIELACEIVGKTFGIATYSRACVAEKVLEDIQQKAVEYLEEQLEDAKTFKVEARRSDKKFPLTSPQICQEVGGYILSKYPHLKVDVKNPELKVTVEVRDFNAFVRGGVVKAVGGIPVGTGGKAAILISGGIDSPVAAYTMAKRGVELTAIHFASPPYTSQRAEEKVCRLLEIVSEYAGRMTMYTVPFTEIQEEIRDKVPEELFTIIMRRLMMEISQRIAEDKGCQALITGESLGQVASQTIGAIACTDIVCSIPVFRPLIGMDKDEIVTISRQIGTFETSIEPYEDCCTVFTPKHPRTRPVLSYVEEAQNQLDCQQLIERAIANVKITKIGYGDR